jgi:predicted DNA-binding antitoxin AbrB/MazE fold protein
MSIMSPRTIEAVYESGVLRPLQPIKDSGNQIYIVTIWDLDQLRDTPSAGKNLRGKYRGFLSSTEEFSRSKQIEKDLER